MSNLSNQKQLFCLINVFGITPTFLLPIYKDETQIYYTQKIDETDTICDFEKVDIEYFNYGSKFYYVNTMVNYRIGSDPIYAIDYNGGFIFGTRQIIITFYSNNLFLFEDSDFVQYMSDFMAENSEIIIKNNSKLTNSHIFEVEKFLSYDRVCSHIVDSMNFYNSLYQSAFIDAIKQRLNTFNIYYSPKKESENYKRIESELFKLLFEKPPIVNLWNDGIIDAYMNHEDFFGANNIEYRFPLFNSFWEKNKMLLFLKKEVVERINRGFGVFYFDISNIKNETYCIITQDFVNKKNYLQLYSKEPSIDDLIQYIIGLSEDICKNVCFILDDKESNVLFYNRTFLNFIRTYNIEFIIPPTNQWHKVSCINVLE